MSTTRAMRHPALELLARYRAVLGAAWAALHELAGPRRVAHEAAFLPAAPSLQKTPVHPAPRRALWVIMGVLLAALLWACIGQVEIDALAPGRIVVSDRTKVVQPLEAGVIRLPLASRRHLCAARLNLHHEPNTRRESLR